MSMKCSICNRTVSFDYEYYTDNIGAIYCNTPSCLYNRLPTCKICGNHMEEWIGTEGCEDKYCSENCAKIDLPPCKVCGNSMVFHFEGNNYCSEICATKDLFGECHHCKNPLSEEWIELRDGKKFCSDECYQTTLPKCIACGNPMDSWIVVEGSSYCNNDCLSRTFKYYRLNEIERKMKNMGYDFLDVLFVGATGSGKSSTINFLTGEESAEVGYGVEPKTMQIGEYRLSNNIQIWDTPGLGDGIATDKIHERKIIEKLNTRISGDLKYGFIDMVVLVVEAGIRDLGTVYYLINNVISPNIKDMNRVVIGLNQADFAMKGQHFDYINNCPDSILQGFLLEKVGSIQRRIKESTGFTPKVIYYSADTGYNVTKFLDTIIDNIPKGKRFIG